MSHDPKPTTSRLCVRCNKPAKETCNLCQDCFDEEWGDVCEPSEPHDDCETCGGDGHVEYQDHPELWGEDCPSRKNHLLPCPDCNGTGRWCP